MSKSRFFYQLKASDELENINIKISNFPELKIKYLKTINNLSLIGSLCTPENDLKILLSIGGDLVVLNNHDYEWKRSTIVGNYRFQGRLLKKIEEDLYIVFSITKLSSFSTPIVDRYSLGDKFSLRLPVDVQSHMIWHLSLSRGLELIDEIPPDKDQKCTKSCYLEIIFIIKAIKPGKQFIVARYGYPGKEEEAIPKIIRYEIDD